MRADNILLMLVLMAGIIILLLSTFSLIMRTWFNVDKRIFFPNPYVNNKHKIIDFILRDIIVMALVIIFSIIVAEVPVGGNW